MPHCAPSIHPSLRSKLQRTLIYFVLLKLVSTSIIHAFSCLPATYCNRTTKPRGKCDSCFQKSCLETEYIKMKYFEKPHIQLIALNSFMSKLQRVIQKIYPQHKNNLILKYPHFLPYNCPMKFDQNKKKIYSIITVFQCYEQVTIIDTLSSYLPKVTINFDIFIRIFSGTV